MKILFVCIQNKNRSQIAEAIFNKFSTDDKAVSAGLRPLRTGVLLRTQHNNPVEVMRDEGYDLSQAKVKKLTRSMVESASMTVLIFNKRLMEHVPLYLRNRSNVELWEVGGISEDTLPRQYIELERERIKKIEARVRDLVKRIETSSDHT